MAANLQKHQLQTSATSLLKLCLVGLLIFVSSYLSLQLVLTVSEKLFFGKLIYKKSCLHGYKFPSNWWNALCYRNRYSDINQLTDSVSRDKPIYKKSKRLVIIGDSFFYGLGLRYEQSVSQILSRKLADQGVEVWNLSRPGDNVVDNYTKYVSAVRYLQPDYIVMGMVDNDLIFRDNRDFPYNLLGEEKIFSDFETMCQSKIVETNNNAIQNLVWDDLITDVYQPSYSVGSGNHCFLEQIAKRMGEDKRVLWMNLSQISSENRCPNYPDRLLVHDISDNIDSEYTRTLEESGNEVINTLNQGKSVFKQISPNENHPSHETHEWYALLIMRKFGLGANN